MKKTLSIITAGLLLAGCTSPTLESYPTVNTLSVYVGCNSVESGNSENSAWCFISGNKHLLLIDDDPEGFANMYLDGSRETAVGVGENWALVCGSTITDDECASIVKPAGGTLIKG